MKKIIFSKTIFLLIFCFLILSSTRLYSKTLLKTGVSLDNPWGMTWIDDQLLITQKSGEIFFVNTNDYSQTKIDHSIPFVQHGQGGLLDLSLIHISEPTRPY